MSAFAIQKHTHTHTPALRFQSEMSPFELTQPGIADVRVGVRVMENW